MSQRITYENGKLVLEVDVTIRLPISVQPVGREYGYLTRRERQVLDGLMEGKCNKEIADKLNLSERTVKAHMTTLLSKFNVSSRFQIVSAMTGNGAIQ